MFKQWLIQSSQDVAIIYQDQPYSYAWLNERVQHWHQLFKINHIVAGTVVTLVADYSPEAIACFIALLELKALVALVSERTADQLNTFCQLAQTQYVIMVDPQQSVEIIKHQEQKPEHPLLNRLISGQEAGLIIFSSGSTGRPKAIVHSADLLLQKLKEEASPKSWRVISFLLFDHIGGFNALFHHLFSGNCIVIPETRTPFDVSRAIAMHAVSVLITSPTFLNLFLISEAYRQFDLSSLKIINYSTEPMPEAILNRLLGVFPDIRFRQSYGSTETSVLKTRQKSADSLFLKILDAQTRIVDGMLEIKNETTMLGYLNAESPFTADGWYKTGDRAVVEGEYIRILGRGSELINVGGEKVYPQEIESLISEMEGVSDAVISGEKNPIMGNIIKLTVHLNTEESEADFKKRLWVFCKGRLASYKVPRKVVLSQAPLHNQRFKKIRQL